MTTALTLRWLVSLAGSAAVSLGIAHFALGQQTAETGAPQLPSQDNVDPSGTDPGTASGTPLTLDDSNFAAEAQVLEEGPIHEAFAEPLSPDVAPGVVVDKEPPLPIDETPPAYRPEGDNVVWIPGYWMWVGEKNDFVWVSGLWRSVPPGRTWTPGHWSTTDGGYVWISGFWTDVNASQVEYLPYPPESIEQGPSSAAPSDNYFWIPGCWRWESNQYVWRPGFWYPGQQNWLWVPDHYVYTPRGAVWVQGYWDYPVQRRGLLYAPVYWDGGFRYGAGYAYTPNRLINTALLLSTLFIDNDRGHYYYGYGYGNRNRYSPWYASRQSRHYDPLYGFYSWQYGRDSNDWKDRFDRDRRRGEDFRDAQRGVAPLNEAPLIATVNDLRSDRRGNRFDDRLRQLSDDERRDAIERSRQMERYRSARAEFEAKRENAYRANLDRSRGEARNQRQARVDVPEDYRPSTFDLRSAAGAEQLRQQARNRNEQYQQRVMRQNLDGRNRAGVQSGSRDRNRGQRGFDELNRQLQQDGSRRAEAMHDARIRGQYQGPPQTPNRRRGPEQAQQYQQRRGQQPAQVDRSRGRGNSGASVQSGGNRGGSGQARGNSGGNRGGPGNRGNSGGKGGGKGKD